MTPSSSPTTCASCCARPQSACPKRRANGPAPDARDAAIAAVHLIDAVEHESLTRGVALALIPGAIEWEEPVRMPHTLEGVAQYERQLAQARELIELRDGLGGSPPPPSNVI
jgi:hypothetical protein